MKPKWLQPALTLLAILVILIALNALFGFLRLRFDLTADRIYTLSGGTKEILGKLETPVQARIYAGASDGLMPPLLKNYARRVEELLREMSQASGGKLEVRVLDPKPDSDAEDSAKLDGIEPQALPNGESVTLGVSFTSLDRKSAIPFLSPERERLLEYDLARAIGQVRSDQKPVLGVMSPLPVMGNPWMMMMGRQGPPPWVLAEELRRNFDVREVPPASEEIPADISVLLVIHPKNISPAAEYALDQFVLRGGRLIVFLDPYCLFDGGFGGPMGPQGTSSDLPNLLPAWGIQFTSAQAVADLTFEGRTREGRAPWLLDLNRTVFNPNDPLTADIETLMLAFAGAFSGNATEGLKQEILFTSSADSQLVDPIFARVSPEAVVRDFSPSGEKKALAIRLTGKFKTAFPEGKPQTEGAEGQEESAKTPEGLKESAAETSVILVGDADFIQDPLTVTEVRGLLPGGRVFIPINGNLAFAQAAVEQLSGDMSLISLRGRAVGRRPFLVLREMAAAAEKKFQATIRELEASLQDTQNRLAELERGKQEGQKYVLTAEQQKEIERFRATEADVRARLKATRRELRAEIDALETRLKWLNIAAVPVAVAIGGLAFGLWRRRHSRAR